MTLIRIFTKRRAALECHIGRRLRNPEVAGDVSQETFPRGYAAELGRATPVRDASLVAVARSPVLGEFRKSTARAANACEGMSGLAVEAAGADPEGIVNDTEIVQAAERALSRMPPRCLDVFRLRRIEDPSHAEITARLDMATNIAEQHIAQALKRCHEAPQAARAVLRRQRRFDDREAA